MSSKPHFDQGELVDEDGTRDACVKGRGGWTKPALARMMAKVSPLTKRAAENLNKDDLCKLIEHLTRAPERPPPAEQIRAKPTNMASAFIDSRIGELVDIVGTMRGEPEPAMGVTSFNMLSGEGMCLPPMKRFTITPLESKGKSNAHVYRMTLDRMHHAIVKVTATHRAKRVPETGAIAPSMLTPAGELKVSAANEAWIHAQLTRGILLAYRAPGVVALGTGYLCDTKAIKTGLDRAFQAHDDNKEWLSVVSVMEEGRYSLHRLMRRAALDDDVFRRILFRILYTLATIRHVFPHFRHNDLHVGNIMMIEGSGETADVYTDGAHTWALDGTRVTPALYDFGFSYMDGAPITIRGSCGIGSNDDGFYDVHTLFNNILNFYQEPGHGYDLPEGTRAFIEAIVPAAIQGDKDHGRFWTGKEPRQEAYERFAARPNIARDLLQHAYFAPLVAADRSVIGTANIWDGFK